MGLGDSGIYKAHRYCGRRLSRCFSLLSIHPPTPRIVGWLGQEIPARQAEWEQAPAITAQLVSGAALCSGSTSGHTPLRKMEEPPQPPLQAPTGRNDGPHREKRVRSCSTKEKASFQELDHGGGGASGMAERPALQGREEPTLIWRQRDSRTPAA